MKKVCRGRLGASGPGPARALLAGTIALALASSAVAGVQNRRWPRAVEARPPVLRPERTASAYSVELPLVVRTGVDAAQTALIVDPAHPVIITLQTSVDLINNTSNNNVVANYQFSYTCVSPTCSPQGGFYRTTVGQITLPAIGAFHQDDFVHYLATLGLLQPGADDGAVGTLLVTFSNLPSSRGWEASAIGNTYSPVFDQLQGSAGFAYYASLFFESAEFTLIGFARDTTASPTVAGSLKSDVGIRSTDILRTNQNVTVDLSFYDPATGQRVGSLITLADIRPGELRQVADIWTSAAIPSVVSSVIVFADTRNSSVISPTIEGFVLLDETHKSPRFLAMLCADPDGCGN